MIVMHTDRGLGSLPEAQIKARIGTVAEAVPDFPLGAFTDIESVLRVSMRRVREAKVLAGRDHVRGFLYDVDCGTPQEISD